MLSVTAAAPVIVVVVVVIVVQNREFYIKLEANQNMLEAIPEIVSCKQACTSIGARVRHVRWR